MNSLVLLAVVSAATLAAMWLYERSHALKPARARARRR